MAEEKNITGKASELRKRAEEKNAQSLENIDALLPKETQQVLHELRVHQIELEMQNEELRTSHAELETERSRYLDLYDLAPVGYCTVSEEGLILEANLTAAVMLDVPRGTLVTQHFGRFIFKEDHDTYYMHRKHLFETRKKKTFDLRMLKKDGTLFWAHLENTTAENEDGTTVCRIVLNDITESKQAEVALARQNNLVGALLENLQIGVYMMEVPSGKPLLANEASFKLLGRGIVPEANSNTISKVYDLYKVDSNEPYPNEELPLIVAMKGESKHVDDMVVAQPDGTRVNLEVFGSLIKDDEGNIWASFVTFQDISARKQAEMYRNMGQKILHILNEPADLQDSLQQVIATVKASIGIDAVGIRLQKGDDYPYYAQEGFSLEFLEKENSLVYRSKEGGLCRDANGKPLLECTCGLVISGKADLSNPLFTRGGSAWTNDSLPLLDLPADHDPRTHPRNTCIHHQYASIALVPIRAKGVIIGLLHLNDRRTGRFTIETVQLLEAIGENIGESLLRKQEETEREKLEAQLHQSQKLESIGHLAGGIAHDFNNMLSVISGYSEIVLSKMNASDPNYSRVQEINKAGKRSADLTRQLLTFARKQTIVPKILDLNVSVAGMLNMLQRLIGENIKLIWMPAANLWKVKMDPSQIDQILANLIVNTRDAISGIGKVIIEIGNAELDEAFCKGHLDFTPGKYVVLSVSDNGCGMSLEILEHIFEPFYTTKEVGKGTGLGLATVFGIVKQNNGFIDVYSEPGKGTTFKIYLPRHESENVGQEGKHEKTKRITGTETVLLVEDETAMLQFVKSQLEDLGYTVLTTDRPIKAIKIAGEYKGDIHLFMTDVVMPEMSGRDLKEKINQIRSGIKCLFMSGYSKDIMSHNGVLDEGIHFLQKPFTAEALSVKVREALA